MLSRGSKSASPTDNKVFRSFSMPQVADQLATLQSQLNNIEHKQQMASESTPEDDFVVYDGQKIKVKKGPSHINGLSASLESPLSDSSKPTTGASKIVSTEHTSDVLGQLRKDLNDSNATVLKQKEQIDVYVARIDQLESFILSLNLQTTQTDSLNITKQTRGVSVSSVDSCPVVHTVLTDADLDFITPKNAVSLPLKAVGGGGVAKQFFPSPELVGETSGSGDGESVLIVKVALESSRKKVPNQLAARLALGSAERRKLGASSGALPRHKRSGSNADDASVTDSTPPIGSPAVSDCGSVNGGGGGGARSTGRKRLLGARKPSMDGRVSTQHSRNNSHASLAQLLEEEYSPPRPMFQWRGAKAASSFGSSADQQQPPVCLFIAHDNPQISKTVAAKLSLSSSSSSSSPSLGGDGPSSSSSKNSSSNNSSGGGCGGGMQIMLESKGGAKTDLTHFILGDIIYSGDYAHVEGAVLDRSRGSECLVVTRLRAVRHPVKQLATRDSSTNKEVIEVNLVDVPADSVIDVSTDAKLADFLSHCQARVDCILDPYHIRHTWYPYYEGSSSASAATHRKMAPQFRSRGIGYIRLGDDMSNFGVAFISLDAGATYLDNGATSIVDSSSSGSSSNNNGPSSANNPPLSATFPAQSASIAPPDLPLQSSTVNLGGILGSESCLIDDKALQEQQLARKTSKRNLRSQVLSARPPGGVASDFEEEDSSEFSNYSSSAPQTARAVPSSGSAKTAQRVSFDSVMGPLQTLKDLSSGSGAAVKWSERTALLKALGATMVDVSRALAQSSSTEASLLEPRNKATVMDILIVLLDNLTKQKNPHVSVATLHCIGTLTYGELLSAHFSVSWRSLAVEAVHMLRNNNKQIFDAATNVLNALYKARSLSFAYITSSSSGLLSDILNGPKAGNSNKVDNSGSITNNGGSNIVKVISWLDSCARADLDLCAKYCVVTDAVLTSPTVLSLQAVMPEGAYITMKSAYLSATGKAIKKISQLLSHREEGTRDSVVGLLAGYLVLFLVLGQSRSVAGYQSLSEQMTSCLNGESSAAETASRIRAYLTRILSVTAAAVAAGEEISQALDSAEKSAPRGYERLLVALVQSVTRAVATMKSFVPTVITATHTAVAAESGRGSGSSSPEQQASAMKESLGLLRANSSRSLSRTPSSSSSGLIRRPRRPTTGSADDGSASAGALSDSPTTKDDDIVPSSGSSTIGKASGAGGRKANTLTVTTTTTSPPAAAAVETVFEGFASRMSPRATPRVHLSEAIRHDSICNPASEAANTSPITDGIAGGCDAVTDSTVGSERIKPRSSVGRSKFNRGGGGSTKQQHVPSPPVSGSVSSASLQQLGDRWFEAKLLLKQVPQTDEAWTDVCKVVKESPKFFQSLSSTAAALSCPVGAVLRAVLPFDEETSSSDQSAIKDSSSTSPSTLLLLMQSSQRRGDVSPQSLAKVETELTRLRAQAVDIRRTVRVKMADEADLKQAMEASTMLTAFVTDLESAISTGGSHSYSSGGGGVCSLVAQLEA